MRISALPVADLFAFTGLHPAQFWSLVDRLWALHPDSQRGRPWALDFADRVLLIAMAYRTNLTNRQLSAVFAVSKSTVDRVLHDLAPHLADLLDTPPTDRRELWLVDGTLIPVHDHTRTAKSKNYRRSSNVQIVARARDRRVVAVGKAWPGNRNDSVVFHETIAPTLPEHPRLSGDGGYRGSDLIAHPSADRTERSSETAHTSGSASARRSPSTPSPDSRTGRSSGSAPARATASTTRYAAWPPCTI